MPDSDSTPSPSDQKNSASQQDVQQPARSDDGARLSLWRRLFPPQIRGWVIAAVAVLLAGFVLFPTASPYDPAPVLKCASNLRQIGLACMMYANANNSHWPDDLRPLITEIEVDPRLFVCPGGADTPATGPTTQAAAADFATPGHLSYVYLGKGLVEPVAPNLVVAYERQQPAGHPGINVLFGDAHVVRIEPSKVPAFLKTAQATNTAFVWQLPK